MTFVFNKKKKNLSLLGAARLRVHPGGGGGRGWEGGRYCHSKMGLPDQRWIQVRTSGQDKSGGSLSGEVVALQDHSTDPPKTHSISSTTSGPHLPGL